MNKKSYVLLAASALMLGACNENAWNDHLDGFQEPSAAEGVTNSTYVLTSADYATIASLDANKALAEASGEEEALAAIGTNGTFLTDEQAQKYIPALLATTNKGLPYFTYNNESSVKVSYNVVSELPENVRAINAGVKQYTITEEDYQLFVWQSEDDFINGFAPSKPAAASLPAILESNVSAKAGDIAIVKYNMADVNPVFGDAEQGGGSATPEWKETSIIASLSEGDEAIIHGLVTAIDARGFVVTDKSGSLLIYQSSGFDQTALPLYSQVIVEGPVATYNRGYQIEIKDGGGSYIVCGEGEYTYPSPKVITGADMDAAIADTDNFLATYVQVTGTVSISGNYYNFSVEGATASTGSGYMVSDYIKEQLEDGKTYTLTGYFMAVSGGKYYNMVFTEVAEAGAKVRRHAVRRAPASSVTIVEQNAIYKYDGSAWKTVSGVIVLNPADYVAMGTTYGNLSGSQPETWLPIYLKTNFPYAAEGDTKTIAYIYYANSASAYVAKEFIFSNGEWVVNAGESVSQFSKIDGEWKYNPSVILDLPYARNTDPSYTYYMACVDWVFENICVPMGDKSLTSGEYFIDYRGNAEFYSGASAYYGNIDVRASSAKSHMPEGYTGYDGLTDDEITLLMKKRFCTEVFPGALEKLNADMKPNDGMEVTVTVNLTAYDGSAVPAMVVFECVAPGKFEYRSSTWVEEGQDADW